MKFLIFAIPFFSLLSTTFSQATIPLDHLSPVDQREQLNRKECVQKVNDAINTYQNVLDQTVRELYKANDDKRDGDAIIGMFLSRMVNKQGNSDCGKRLEKLILTSKGNEAIEINWEVWKMYQRGEITRLEWLEDFSTSIEDKVLFYK
jgi:hypothetical protein